MNATADIRPTFRYLSGEGKRNRLNADLYQAMLCLAWGEGCQVITGHHVSFLFNGDLETEDEVPSADCLLFDHHIMGCVFGEDAQSVMVAIAPLERYERENYVRALLVEQHPELGLSPDPVHAPA